MEFSRNYFAYYKRLFHFSQETGNLLFVKKLFILCIFFQKYFCFETDNCNLFFYIINNENKNLDNYDEKVVKNIFINRLKSILFYLVEPLNYENDIDKFCFNALYYIRKYIEIVLQLYNEEITITAAYKQAFNATDSLINLKLIFSKYKLFGNMSKTYGFLEIYANFLIIEISKNNLKYVLSLYEIILNVERHILSKKIKIKSIAIKFIELQYIEQNDDFECDSINFQFIIITNYYFNLLNIYQESTDISYDIFRKIHYSIQKIKDFLENSRNKQIFKSIFVFDLYTIPELIYCISKNFEFSYFCENFIIFLKSIENLHSTKIRQKSSRKSYTLHKKLMSNWIHKIKNLIYEFDNYGLECDVKITNDEKDEKTTIKKNNNKTIKKKLEVSKNANDITFSSFLDITVINETKNEKSKLESKKETKSTKNSSNNRVVKNSKKSNKLYKCEQYLYDENNKKLNKKYLKQIGDSKNKNLDNSGFYKSTMEQDIQHQQNETVSQVFMHDLLIPESSNNKASSISKDVLKKYRNIDLCKNIFGLDSNVCKENIANNKQNKNDCDNLIVCEEKVYNKNSISISRKIIIYLL